MVPDIGTRCAGHRNPFVCEAQPPACPSAVPARRLALGTVALGKAVLGFPGLRPEPQHSSPLIWSLSALQCGNMAREGLRVLVVAKKSLTEEQYQDFEVSGSPDFCLSSLTHLRSHLP